MRKLSIYFAIKMVARWNSQGVNKNRGLMFIRNPFTTGKPQNGVPNFMSLLDMSLEMDYPKNLMFDHFDNHQIMDFSSLLDLMDYHHYGFVLKWTFPLRNRPSFFHHCGESRLHIGWGYDAAWSGRASWLRADPSYLWWGNQLVMGVPKRAMDGFC